MTYQYESVFGWLQYQTQEDVLIRVSWLDEKPESCRIHKEMHHFWRQWFLNLTMDCPLQFSLVGTDFQIRVWTHLQSIPFGETCSYGQLARWIGSPGAQQAVGQACKANPISLLIPCHRVIGAKNDLVGYVGRTKKPLKARLLQWERDLLLQ